MYYCKSRYYAPELCRFISLDDIEYLDPKSFNGLNPIYNNILNQGSKHAVNAVGLWTKSSIYSFTSSGLSSLFSGWY